MTSPFKGAIMRAMSAAQGRAAPKRGGIRGALAQAVTRAAASRPVKGGRMVAPPPGKNVVTPTKSHGFRNAGPIKPSVTAEADATMAQTGEGLRRTIGKIAGRVVRRKEGGKVSAMSALQSLAKRYRAALDSGDEVLARRIKREMELKKGKAPESESESTKKGREDKLATFAKGGKVSRIKRMQDILARDFRAAKKLKDTDSVRVRFGSKEDTHVRAGGKKYSFQAGSDDDRFVFRSKDGEEVPVEFSKEWLKEIE